MGKRGMGWVPDYPDVRDCKANDFQAKGSQKTNAQGSDLSEITDDRLLQLICAIKTALPTAKNLLSNLEAEINNKIHFLPATYIDDVLLLESECKEVEDVQRKLQDLGYLKNDATSSETYLLGYFDQATEVAIREFQKAQLLSPTGIYTAITKAELLALAAIKYRDDQFTYKLGDSGIGVVCIQQILENSKYKFKIDDLIGSFDDSTHVAVQKFQTERVLEKEKEALEKEKEALEKEKEAGIVGPATRAELRACTNKSLNIFPVPIPRRQFKAVEQQAGAAVDVSFKTDKIDSVDRLKVVEILVQLAPYMGQNLDLADALSAAHAVLKKLLNQIKPGSDQVELLANWIEQNKGYTASNILRYQNYQLGSSGSAIIYIQERLRALGYYTAPTTGYFEQLTQEAVKRYQIDQSPPQVPEEQPSSGEFRLVDVKTLLTTTEEEFKFLESPLSSQLINYLIESMGGTEAIIASVGNENLLKQADQIEQSVQKLRRQARSLLTEKLGQDEEPVNNVQPNGDPCEQAKQNLLEIVKQLLHSIAKAITQIIAPIGQYDSPELAFKEGFKRFKVLANFEQIKKIDRILKGLTHAPDDQIGLLAKCYEPLTETLAVLQSELKQYERLPKEANSIWQFQRLAINAVEAVQLIRLQGSESSDEPALIVEKLKEFVIQNLYVSERIVQDDCRTPESLDAIVSAISTIVSVISNGGSPIDKLVRQPTIIRLEHTCNGCLLQVPVAGNLYRTLSKPSPRCKSRYLALPTAVDLSLWCSEVEDQGELDACTAHAGVALVEYFEKKSFGKSIDASRQFLYKVTRNLMHRRGDTGASVRETMKAMVLFGVPPEEHCPYDEAAFDDDPSAFCYAFAQNYQAINYFRLDDAGISTQELLAQIKTMLVTGFPCMFGFTVYSSIHDPANPPGYIPYPDLSNDKQEGGHAAIVVGYDDYRRIKNAAHPGALLIKNSWGKDWGAGGYGWLPYDYVLSGLARDWWSLIKSEWVESNQFGLGSERDWTASFVGGGSVSPGSNVPPRSS